MINHCLSMQLLRVRNVFLSRRGVFILSGREFQHPDVPLSWLPRQVSRSDSLPVANPRSWRQIHPAHFPVFLRSGLMLQRLCVYLRHSQHRHVSCYHTVSRCSGKWGLLPMKKRREWLNVFGKEVFFIAVGLSVVLTNRQITGLCCINALICSV